MKRIWKMIKEIPDVVNLSKSEFLLTVAVSALAGIVIGMIISPKKEQIVGCNNGTTYISPDESDTDDEFED